MQDKKTDSGLPAINLNGAKKSTGKKTRKTEGILARLPKMKATGGTEKTGLLSRLMNVSRRDMAFMGSAAALVVSLPIGANYMMKPANDNILKPGFSTRETAAATGELFEPGTGGFAPGGSDGDLVTPLSLRDPSSLITTGEEKKPETPSFSAPPTTPKNDFRDDVRNAGAMAMTTASKANPVTNFSPPVKIQPGQGAGRGLGAVGGGTKLEATLLGSDISKTARSAAGTATPRNMIAPVGGGNYKGTSSPRSPDGGSNGNLEQLKSKSDSASKYLNQQGAVSSLDKAGAAAVDTGGSSAAANKTTGSGGMNPDDKFGKTNGELGRSQTSASKDKTLAQQIAEKRALAAVDREIKLQQQKDQQALENENLMRDTILGFMKAGFIDPLAKATAKMTTDALNGTGGSGGTPSTPQGSSGGKPSPLNITGADQLKPTVENFQAYGDLWDAAGKASDGCAKAADTFVNALSIQAKNQAKKDTMGKCGSAQDAISKLVGNLTKSLNNYDEVLSKLAADRTSAEGEFDGQNQKRDSYYKTSHQTITTQITELSRAKSAICEATPPMNICTPFQERSRTYLDYVNKFEDANKKAVAGYPNDKQGFAAWAKGVANLQASVKAQRDALGQLPYGVDITDTMSDAEIANLPGLMQKSIAAIGNSGGDGNTVYGAMAGIYGSADAASTEYQYWKPGAFSGLDGANNPRQYSSSAPDSIARLMAIREKETQDHSTPRPAELLERFTRDQIAGNAARAVPEYGNVCKWVNEQGTSFTMKCSF